MTATTSPLCRYQNRSWRRDLYSGWERLPDEGLWFSTTDLSMFKEPGPFPVSFGRTCGMCVGSGEDWDGLALFCVSCGGSGITPEIWYQWWFESVPPELKDDARKWLVENGHDDVR